jgi:hypothetical protein
MVPGALPSLERNTADCSAQEESCADKLTEPKLKKKRIVQI